MQVPASWRWRCCSPLWRHPRHSHPRASHCAALLARSAAASRSSRWQSSPRLPQAEDPTGPRRARSRAPVLPCSRARQRVQHGWAAAEADGLPPEARLDRRCPHLCRGRGEPCWSAPNLPCGPCRRAGALLRRARAHARPLCAVQRLPPPRMRRRRRTNRRSHSLANPSRQTRTRSTRRCAPHPNPTLHQSLTTSVPPAPLLTTSVLPEPHPLPDPARCSRVVASSALNWCVPGAGCRRCCRRGRSRRYHLPAAVAQPSLSRARGQHSLAWARCRRGACRVA